MFFTVCVKCCVCVAMVTECGYDSVW